MLQSCDMLLSNITWRERFIATCMRGCTDNEKNIIKGWSGPHLGGLRWEVISGFCMEACKSPKPLSSWSGLVSLVSSSVSL